MPTTLAWHYTTGAAAERILASGLLLPGALHVPRDERPILWFSASPRFEPTARKRIPAEDGKRSRLLTMVEMAELPDGLWRFGLPTTDLLDWRKLKQAAHLSPETKRTLEMTARALGARRELWYGSFEPIELAVCRAQRFSVEADEWRDALRLVEP